MGTDASTVRASRGTGQPAAVAAEEFSEEETRILRRHFTNIDQPVFALVNLPEVVKGALFARYSRSSASLRRLFLDEFADGVEPDGGRSADDSAVGVRRAADLYDRVFYEYGDDSVAQLGGVHLACEQSSNLLTKVLEWGRLMSYLEQSTRYIAYDQPLAGGYRYHRSPEIMSSELGSRYVSDMDRIFWLYSAQIGVMSDFFYRSGDGPGPGGSEAAYRRAVKAKALDSVRGMLPAASLSNVGIYGTGQAYEALLVRMRSHPLPEARARAEMMLAELRKVIPSFLRRVDDPERGVLASEYLASNRAAMTAAAERVFAGTSDDDDGPAGSDRVDLVDFDPDGEVKMIAAMLYPHTSLPDRAVEDQVRAMSLQERLDVMRSYCGERRNRRHRPGRALERTSYRFDVLSDYGAFRDLQRHRMLTIEWQSLSPRHGYNRPAEVDDAGAAAAFEEAMSVSAGLYDALAAETPAQAPYALSFAHRVRYSMQMNAREAMHVLELRTTPQGHPAYRRLCQRMHRLIGSKAGHRAVAEMMKFVDHGSGPGLGRLQAERRAETRAPKPAAV